MKQLPKYIGVLFSLLLVLSACEDTIENIEIQKPIPHTGEYYANLRAFKQSPHQLSFGWFGGWTAMGASKAKYLTSVPDSVDIVSIWGKWYDLSDSQKEDMAHVQQVKGTKVLFTIFAHEIPAPFGKTADEIGKYAKALADSVNKYNYDGLDLDYEPNYGGKGPLVKKDTMEIFVRALSQYLGPKSDSGKILAIDGEPYFLNMGLAELFDYGIVQSYESPGDIDLQYRFDKAYAVGWKPEQYIFTENFESYWQTGGVTRYVNSKGERMPSLIGMARFQPTQGVKGGCGTYHMEYEYNHTDMDYKFLRQAIQIMNPSIK